MSENIETVISAEAKKCFWENEREGTKGIMVHRAAYVAVLWKGKHELTFKVTGKGKWYDSRDKGKKPVEGDFVKAELRRMLGIEQGTVAFVKTQQALALAAFS
jgi:hypothetical protein